MVRNRFEKLFFLKVDPNLKNLEGTGNRILTSIQHELEKYNIVKKTIKDYQKFIKDNFNYVGDNFAYEARSIHYNGKKKSKGIYGSASKEDLKELKEEGIDAQMIPWIDEKEN